MSLIRTPLACQLEDAHRGTVAVLGNFDGVHRGHRMLIGEAKALADQLGKPLTAVTFEPHPRRAFDAEAAPFILTPIAAKAELLSEAGCEKVFALPFIEELYRQSPHEFIDSVLHKVLGLSGIVTGKDFQFGRGREGSSETLAEIAGGLGLTYKAVEPVGASDEKYSSSQARDAIRNGNPKAAREILGYDWFLDGTVADGRRLARTLGFPTANIALGDVLRPLYGVYAVLADVDGVSLPGVANIGVRPTVDGKEERLEVHLFDWDGDLYGKTLRCRFVDFIREERAMAGLDALKAQIAEDSAAARKILS